MNHNTNVRMSIRRFFMNIVLILAFLAAFYNVKLLDYNSDYLSVQQTRNLKGIFTLIVIFHHLSIFAGVGDVYTIFINSGYIAVGGFLFISGYGLMYQYMRKGRNYVKSFLKRRLVSIILPAVVMAIAYFAIKSYRYGYTLNTLIYDFKRGASVISNGWYINAIIYFYITFFISMVLAEIIKKPRFMIIFTFIATYLYIILCMKFKFDDHWFSAAFAFYFGVIWALFKSKIDLNLMKSIPIIIGCLFVLYYVLNVFTVFKYGWMEFKCLMYLAIIVILGMKIKLQSPFMEWVGDHSYEIYMVHGIFFEVLRNNHINLIDGFAFMVTLLILTFISSYVLHKIFTFINKKIINS